MSVNVLCVVLPNGSVVYAAAREGSAKEVMDEFRASLSPQETADYAAARTMGGVVAIRIREVDYEKLQVRP